MNMDGCQDFHLPLKEEIKSTLKAKLTLTINVVKKISYEELPLKDKLT